MTKENRVPFLCHVFVCTNDRQGRRKSCADGNSAAVRAKLKEGINDRGWKGKVRVSQSGCLGLCQKGPNVVIYPDKVWFTEVTESDVETILSRVQTLMASHG